MSSKMTFFVVFNLKYLLYNDMDVTCTIIMATRNFLKTGGSKMYAKSSNVKIFRGGGTGFNSLHYHLCGSIYPSKGGSLCRYGRGKLL